MKLKHNIEPICKICNQQFTKLVALTTHIQKKHGITVKEYYDSYIKQENEGICKLCGNPTKWTNKLNYGYSDYCSNKCATAAVERVDKILSTRKQNTEWFPNGVISGDERRKKYIEKHGHDYKFMTSEYKEKIHDIANKRIKDKYFKYFNNDDSTYIDYADQKFIAKCNICNNNFELGWQALQCRLANNSKLCTFCNPVNPITSDKEKAICKYLDSLNITYECNNRTIIGKELDIYIPEYKIAIEFDGLHWHSEEFRPNNYHLNKTVACENNGIQLIHIFEDEWDFKQEIVKSRLSSLFHKNHTIYARKCIVKEISYSTAEKFLNINHIQGTCKSKRNFGLFYNDELVAVMTFGKSRFKNEYELMRYCNKLYLNVVGGASKLFKYFIKNSPEINHVISYADRRWSIGKLYESLGFNKCGITKPSYFYIVSHKCENRMKYQKHKLVAQGFSSDMSEHEIMLSQKIYRIYDCGHLKYEFYKY